MIYILYQNGKKHRKTGIIRIQTFPDRSGSADRFTGHYKTHTFSTLTLIYIARIPGQGGSKLLLLPCFVFKVIILTGKTSLILTL